MSEPDNVAYLKNDNWRPTRDQVDELLKFVGGMVGGQSIPMLALLTATLADHGIAHIETFSIDYHGDDEAGDTKAAIDAMCARLGDEMRRRSLY